IDLAGLVTVPIPRDDEAAVRGIQGDGGVELAGGRRVDLEFVAVGKSAREELPGGNACVRVGAVAVLPGEDEAAVGGIDGNDRAALDAAGEVVRPLLAGGRGTRGVVAPEENAVGVNVTRLGTVAIPGDDETAVQGIDGDRGVLLSAGGRRV